MRPRVIPGMGITAFCMLALAAGVGHCTPAGAGAGSADASAVEQGRSAVARTISFLESDAQKWRKERGCATCHHGMMTVWALSEAKAQGYPVNEQALTEFMNWARDGNIPRLDQQRDPRPGWSLVSQRAVYLAMMSYNLPILSRDEVNRIAVHLARHQEEDGAWSIPPPANAPPPVFFESREVVALFALLAWEPYLPADADEAAANAASRKKAQDWLSKCPPTGTTQALALHLLLDVRTGKPAERALEALLKRQNADGGWGQENGMGSDAFATGQALYVLSFAGLDRSHSEVRRALAFLISTQRQDGSWAVSPRNHPGVDWKRTGVAMNYFGSAWAELGLARYIPSPPDTPARRQVAFDTILGYHGKYEVDEASPERPVVRVDMTYYDIDDGGLAALIETLRAFPRLAALDVKSPRITDKGLAALKGLPRLRRLTLIETPITDAGLVHLGGLTDLQTLVLKNTKVTENGVLELRKALPSIQVERQ